MFFKSERKIYNAYSADRYIQTRVSNELQPDLSVDVEEIRTPFAAHLRANLLSPYDQKNKKLSFSVASHDSNQSSISNE